MGPRTGSTDVTVGGGSYVNPFGKIAVPLELVTSTSTGPAATARGDLHVRLVAPSTLMKVAAVFPISTRVSGVEVKPVPVTVMRIPPDMGPKSGSTLVTVGFGL